METYQQHSKSGKVITTQETQKVFGSPLYRPSQSRLPLVSSNGLYQQFFTIQNGMMGSPKRVLSHWDIFHKGNEWVVVKQDVDSYTTNLLNTNETHREEYPWYMKVMQIPGSGNDTLITPLGNGNRNLSMHILNQQGKVIRLQVIGNLAEEEMISLAAAYKPQSPQPELIHRKSPTGERRLANRRPKGVPHSSGSDSYDYGSKFNSAQCGCASRRRSMSRNALSERLSLL